MDFIFVSIGGAIGALLRFYIGSGISKKIKIRFPLGTLFINISGAFLLGVFTAELSDGYISNFICDGLLGAYTTFSTFVCEGYNFLRENQLKKAFLYFFLSVLLGVTFFSAGFVLANVF